MRRWHGAAILLGMVRGISQVVLEVTCEELLACGVAFPQPPIRQPFGWWSMFEDSEGNRFALTSRREVQPASAAPEEAR